MSVLRRAFITASIAWAVLLPIAPFAASRPSPAPAWYALAFAMYAAGSFICHQMPARSYHLWAAQMPVCARCTGLYAGAALGVVLCVASGFRSTIATWHARLLLAGAALPTAVTLAYEWTTGVAPSNTIRALAGAPLGAAIAITILSSLTDPRA
jgi:uncharacterized membrane protein